MASEYASTALLKSGELGPKLIDVLERAWTQPFSTKSNYAREYAMYVAIAASMGWLTTRIHHAQFSNTWHITSRGLSWLAEQEQYDYQ